MHGTRAAVPGRHMTSRPAPARRASKLDVGPSRPRVVGDVPPWRGSFLAARSGSLHGVSSAPPPDQALWSPQRIAAWQKAADEPFPAPLAVLRIPKIRLEVAVLPGTDDRTLDRGAGHIEDTALPGAPGNSGIAGHRDGFFRGLKDIGPGDVIELDTLAGQQIFRVERTWVVDPEDVSVLDPTPASSLTLVTCYPFYFIGSAPQRFIVRAVRVNDTTITAALRPPRS